MLLYHTWCLSEFLELSLLRQGEGVILDLAPTPRSLAPDVLAAIPEFIEDWREGPLLIPNPLGKPT